MLVSPNSKQSLNLTRMKSMIIGSNRKLSGISSFSVSVFDTDINSVSSLSAPVTKINYYYSLDLKTQH